MTYFHDTRRRAKKKQIFRKYPLACCAPQKTARVVLTPSSKVLRVAMDLFQHRYYRLSKILMMLVGQWPYQSTRAKRGFLGVLIIFTSSGIAPTILAVMKYRNNSAMLMESFLLYTLGTISFMKMVSFIKFSQQVSYNCTNYNIIIEAKVADEDLFDTHRGQN